MSDQKLTKAEKTRRHIVEKSATLFNQHGFAGTSMQDIMEATLLSKGALYGHFDNKESIAVAAFQRAVELVYEEVSQRTRVIDHTLDKLKAVVYFYKERILDPPVEGGCPIQNSSVDASERHPALRKQVVEAMDNWQDRIVYTLQKGMRKGEVRMDLDARQFAIRFIGTLEGGILLAQLYEDVQYFDAMAQQLLAMIESIRSN